MIQNPANFTIENTDILRPPWHLDAKRLLNRQRPGMFLIHWRHIIQTIKIGQSLKIGFVLNQLFRTAMQKADMRIGALDHFAIHFQHKPQNAVRCRMLRAKIHRNRFDLHLCHVCLFTPYFAVLSGSALAALPPSSLCIPSHGLRKSKSRNS